MRERTRQATDVTTADDALRRGELWPREKRQALLDGKSIVDTRIYAVLQRVLPSASQVLLWYGDDWQNLPEVVDAQTLLQRLEQDLRSPSAESWLRYRNPALVRTDPRSRVPEQKR